MHRTKLKKKPDRKGTKEATKHRRRAKQLEKALTDLIRRATNLERKYARSGLETGRQGARVLKVILQDATKGLRWLQTGDNLEQTIKRVLLLLMWLEFLFRTLG